MRVPLLIDLTTSDDCSIPSIIARRSAITTFSMVTKNSSISTTSVPLINLALQEELVRLHTKSFNNYTELDEETVEYIQLEDALKKAYQSSFHHGPDLAKMMAKEAFHQYCKDIENSCCGGGAHLTIRMCGGAGTMTIRSQAAPA
mmetsp:Transcript_4609/g.6996  ORF Transcript_4609/g.6996 Transcript_4609/m.6996 type:complete len:145 (+) Transcript_4609:418-852(+)